MEPEMKHEHGHGKHKDHHHGHNYWASWCSPIGIGVFLMTTSIAAAVALYTVFTLISGVMPLSQRPEPQQQYPVNMHMPADSGAMMQSAQ